MTFQLFMTEVYLKHKFNWLLIVKMNLFIRGKYQNILKKKKKKKNVLAERGFDPRTSGLWAQHASAAPLCFSVTI